MRSVVKVHCVIHVFFVPLVKNFMFFAGPRSQQCSAVQAQGICTIEMATTSTSGKLDNTTSEKMDTTPAPAANVTNNSRKIDDRSKSMSSLSYGEMIQGVKKLNQHIDKLQEEVAEL